MASQKSNVALLRLLDLPVFSNDDELANLMHLDTSVLSTYRNLSNKFYRRYKIAKSNGKLREIREPTKELKGIQAWILRNILDKLAKSAYATAYIKKKNILDNVNPHINNRYFICIDLEDFFPSISMRRVEKVFLHIGYSKSVSATLAHLCTSHENLPQGAVTSPALSNIIAAKLDRRIAGYTSKRNIIFTRYSDDITISSNNYAVLQKSLIMIFKIIRSEHFDVNLQKLRVLGPRRRCTITGLVKNSSEAKFGIGKRKKRQMRAVMHHYVFTKDRDVKYATDTSINGWLNYLKTVDEESYSHLSSYWNRLKEMSKA